MKKIIILILSIIAIFAILYPYALNSSSLSPSRSTTIPSEKSCQDSDVTGSFPKGMNPYKRGFIKHCFQTLTGVRCTQTSSQDYCLDETTLLEYYCEGSEESYESVPCAKGCENSICLN